LEWAGSSIRAESLGRHEHVISPEATWRQEVKLDPKALLRRLEMTNMTMTGSQYLGRGQRSVGYWVLNSMHKAEK
jgi:hypothetical protein